MTNKNYNRGRAFEYRVKRFLENRGYMCFRSAGSHSVADLIAFKRKTSLLPNVLLIQAKYGNARISPREHIRLAEVAGDYDCIPVLATAKPRQKIKFINLHTSEQINM